MRHRPEDHGTERKAACHMLTPRPAPLLRPQKAGSKAYSSHSADWVTLLWRRSKEKTHWLFCSVKHPSSTWWPYSGTPHWTSPVCVVTASSQALSTSLLIRTGSPLRKTYIKKSNETTEIKETQENQRPCEEQKKTVGCPRWVEAGGTGRERIHLRQNNGHRSSWNTLQGSSGQRSKAPAVTGGGEGL